MGGKHSSQTMWLEFAHGLLEAHGVDYPDEDIMLDVQACGTNGADGGSSRAQAHAENGSAGAGDCPAAQENDDGDAAVATKNGGGEKATSIQLEAHAMAAVSVETT